MRDRQQIIDEADRAVRGDAKFFDRFPMRRYRVRQASQAEIQANAMAWGAAETACVPGYRWFTLVKVLDPGVRLRNFVRALAGNETDMSDAEARQVWDVFAQPGSQIVRVERQMREAIARTRGRA